MTVQSPQRPFGAGPQHAVVIFGASVQPDGQPSENLVARLETALALAERDPNAVVVPSGGVVNGPAAEAQVMRDWLVDHGVAPERIALEDQARYTVDNAERVASLLDDLDDDLVISRVTLVTQDFHMPRSLFLLRHALDEVGLRAVDLRAAIAKDPSDLEYVDDLRRHERAALERDAIGQARLHWRRACAASGDGV